MIACASEKGMCLLEFEDRPDLEKQIRHLENSLKLKPMPGRCDHLDLLEQQLEDYFRGKLIGFQLPLVFTGTGFQYKVWERLVQIPCGQTITYRQLAGDLGNPLAIRAVAAANGANKLALLVPCHRVIGSAGNLTGYAGGLWRKQWLLDHESKQARLPF
jgi:AraC family transcriptional regulator of adaptative response/methylated-DNA-[protein]-cysteine methyltransferase